MIQIRPMSSEDIDKVHRIFHEHHIRKPEEYIRSCWEEHQRGERTTLLAFVDGQFAGSLHLLAQSHYPYFAENGIPEINDFNVIPPYRRQGVGSALMDSIEQTASKKYRVVGIGVGLYESYGSAQRMYAKRGYVPDGRGIMYNQQPVIPGSQVCVDDDLNLYFTKNV